MSNFDRLQEIKERIRSSIAWNSDRGFVLYSGCNRVCSEFASILTIADVALQSEDYQRAFDIYILVFLETVKLASHADDSGGGCSDIVHYCIEQIDEVCRRVSGLDTKENELKRLLEVVKSFESYIEYYGKQLAAEYPEEVHRIFEEYILKEAKQATDRGKYKRVCHLLKNFAEANGKEQALILAERLIEMYPRRPAMLDELERLKKKLNK